MKIAATLIAVAIAAPAVAETFHIVGPGMGPVHSVDSRDVARIDGRVDDARSEARHGIAGVAAFASIEALRDRPSLGAGVARWQGQTGWAVKGSVPLGVLTGSVGAFGSGGDVGVAGSVVVGW